MTAAPTLAEPASQIHMTLQGKGGVGKSMVSSFLAQYLSSTGRPVTCIDTDPVNDTLSGYAALNARRLDLLQGNQINTRRFDEMMELLMSSDTSVVVDNGAASFLPLTSYMLENGVADLLAASGRQLVVHTVVTGGQAIMDTLTGFDQLARQLPDTAQMVVWLNEYFGDISAEGKSFEAMKAYQANRHRVKGLVRIKRYTSETFGKDMEMMLDRKFTFDEAVSSPDFGLMAKQRLTMMKRDIFGQIALVV
ncbi:conjugal transfer protein TraL [Azospirillum thermophilum]|uniref:Conjugal transfer protein TraL n=2 Tax=Azospirillum thermophilum TaxID=2202148 RepID=A0A2S2CW43_9PROT|nr:conjugal transfer protein TraL [Azospirillum thermophilum]